MTMERAKIDELFARTLEGSYDDDEPWAAVSALRRSGNEFIFEKAVAWCNSDEPLKRARGADILGQLRRAKQSPDADKFDQSEPIFVSESLAVISGMLVDESDETALSSEIIALGHLYRAEAIPLIRRYAADPRDEIRFAVCHSLGHFPQDVSAIEALTQLADDPDDDIRNWALFALGTQSDFDSPALRELLVWHLNDTNDDAREEAIAGLAKRNDARAALPVLRLMESGSYYSHHHYDFLNLVDHQDDMSEWGTDDFVDALYEKYSDILPPRNPQSSNQD